MEKAKKRVGKINGSQINGLKAVLGLFGEQVRHDGAVGGGK
jgi:hypothetical protein